MKHSLLPALGILIAACASATANAIPPFPADPRQHLERTCFQTAQPYNELSNLRSDVAIVYGVDPALPQRIKTWRDRGYRIHVMTGVSWGNYQNYLYGRYDGINHEDEAQTDINGNKISHGGDVYYMCPGTNFGKFLAVGVQRALDAGAEAIHLEEPEFWVRGGYSEGFKREWQSYYGEQWQAPHSSVDAQWRSSKLKYFLYRRALQQVFDHVQDYNKRTGRRVRCYVPTHSLLSYAHWRIVSPESSLARLKGCDGYIAQVWTGTARTPNVYRGQFRERTFETAFLEYGVMQNLVRSTGRTVWYLNDPVEDNPAHDWEDYRINWEATMTASLFQPDVWQFEVAPWPERIFGGRYPHGVPEEQRKPMPPAYATEVQTVMNALNDMKQRSVKWDCGTTGLGVLVSDSLMFQRGEPNPSDPNMSHVFGLALPLLKRGMPVTPVQLENVTIRHYLDAFRILLLSYQGMKPLRADVHLALANWVKSGGVLIVCDDDSDPYNKVRDWWNSGPHHYATPREHLFAQLGQPGATFRPGELASVGRGALMWLREHPAAFAADAAGDARLADAVKTAAARAKLIWRETNYLLLQRGPYVIAAGLDESAAGGTKVLRGKFVNLFDPALKVRSEIAIEPASRLFLVDLRSVTGGRARVVAAACKALPLKQSFRSLTLAVEGVVNTPAIVLVSCPRAPKSASLGGQPLTQFQYSAKDRLLWLLFTNTATPRELSIQF